MTARSKKTEIDPDADYEVDLLRSYKLGRVTLSPRDSVTVKGTILLDMREKGVVKEDRPKTEKVLVAPEQLTEEGSANG